MPKRNTPEHNTPPGKTKEKKTKSEAGRKDKEEENDTEVTLCVSCNKSVDEQSILCDCCQNWEHRQCAGISKEEFDVLTKSSASIMFFCKPCQPKVSLSLKFFNDIQDSRLISPPVLRSLRNK